VLAFTAAKMVVSEPMLMGLFGDVHTSAEPMQHAARWVAYALAIAGVLGAGWLTKRKRV
jgi:hypothetical protein